MYFCCGHLVVVVLVLVLMSVLSMIVCVCLCVCVCVCVCLTFSAQFYLNGVVHNILDSTIYDIICQTEVVNQPLRVNAHPLSKTPSSNL